MISEDIRFVAGEDIKQGDVVKYVDRIGVVKAGSGFVDDPMRGRVLTPEPRAVTKVYDCDTPSPYNAKPVPRFEVEPVRHGSFAGWFKVRMLVYRAGGVFEATEYVPRTWFRKNQAAAILAKQRRMAEDYAMTQRLSGSVETLTGVRLV